jgi:hypothetical protein
MNVPGKHTRYLREGRLDPLPHQHLVILERQLLSALRVLLSANRESNSICLIGSIFCRVIRVAAIHKYFTTCWELQRQHIQSAHVTGSAWHKSKLYWQPRISRHDVNLHSIEVATFSNALASELLASHQATPLYANVVAQRYRERVEQVLSRDVGLLEQPSELMKKADGQFFNLMQTPAQTRLAQHTRDKARLLHKAASVFKVATEIKGRCKSSCNDFCVRKFASWVISMADSFKQIVRDTVERDNIVEPDPLLNSIGVGSEGIFSFSKSFAKCSSSNLD